MIYKFKCGTNNIFYLSADTKSQLYKRVFDMYRVAKEDIEILAEYKETANWGVKLEREYTKDVDNNLLSKASTLFKKSIRRSEPSKTEYIKKYKFQIKDVETPEDLIPILKTYKKVKIYWDLTEKRGVHSYYALYK